MSFRIWYIAILCGSAFFSVAAGTLFFDSLEADLLSGSAGQTLKRISLPDGNRSVPAVIWRESKPGTIRTRFLTTLPHFKCFYKAPVTLSLYLPEALFPEQVVLRMEDRTGRIFKFFETPGILQGHVKLRFMLLDKMPLMPFERVGSDEIIDWPLRFSGVEFHIGDSAPQNGMILFDSLEYPDEDEQISSFLDTGHPMNLLLPGNRNNPVLVLTNRGMKSAEFSGAISVFDLDGNRNESEIHCQLAPQEELRLPVSGDFSRQGFWLVNCRFKRESGMEFSENHRFARMNPAGPTPERAEGFLFGLCGHPERFSRSEAIQESIAAGLCGAKILRLELSWRKIQPKQDVWDYELYDFLAEHFRRNGIEFQFLFSVDAPWAVDPNFKPKMQNVRRVGGNWLPCFPAFSEFVARSVERYRGQCSYYEIWNEPDLAVFANYPANQYMKLLEAGYDAVKKADSTAKVMNGGVAFNGSNRSNNPAHNSGIYDALLDDGGKHFDLFAFHGHGEFSFYAGQLDGLARKYGLITPDRPWGWYSNETAISSANAGEKKQAEVLYKKLLYAWANGAIGYNWYLLREKSYYPPGHHERHFGLLTTEFMPKPAYIVYNMLAATFKGGRFRERVPAGDGVYALLFESSGGDGLLALWSETQERILIVPDLPAGTVRIDLAGNEVPLEMYGGLALLKLSRTPFTLKMPKTAVGKLRLNTEILPPEQLLLSDTGTLVIPIGNETGKQIIGVFTLETPDGKHSVRRITLRPGESARPAFALKAPKQPGETKARLHFALDDSRPESVTIGLFRGNVEKEVRFRLFREEQYRSLVPSAPGNEHLYWGGPEDLAATVALRCDGNALKLRVEVTDDRHVQPHRGWQVWQGDNIQFGLSLPGQDTIWKLGLTRLNDGRPEVFCWEQPAGFSSPVPRIRLVCERKENLTVYKAEIPFGAVGLSRETARAGFRFNLIVNDNDGEQRKGFLRIAPGLGYKEDEVGFWPVVMLEQAGK